MNRKRLLIVLALVVITPIGFMTKFYTGTSQEWVNNSLGGVFYEIFWSLAIGFLWVNTKPWKIAGFVFAITCLLEFLQCWHPPFLEVLRNHFLGRTILGTSFNMLDIPYYFIGSLGGYFLLRLIGKADPQSLAR